MIWPCRSGHGHGICVLFLLCVVQLHELVTDKHTAYATSVKMMALDVIDLLYGDAALGRQIAAEKAPMTKAEYIAAMDAFTSTVTYEG